MRFDGSGPGGTTVLVVQGVKAATPLAAIGSNFVKAEKKQFPKATITTKSATVAGQKAIKVTIRYHGSWAGKTGTHDVEHNVWTFRRGAYAYVFDFGSVDTAIAKARTAAAKSVSSAHFTDTAPKA